MDWLELISDMRLTENDKTLRDQIGKSDDIKSDPFSIHEHQSDVDRIMYSSAFRRLQGKTQVFIFPDTDYFRTRLTHTFEVSNIGRLLATSALRVMAQEESNSCKALTAAIRTLKIEQKDVVDCVSAACLAHDIGNPPFGHIGEYAIRSWFQDNISSGSAANNWLHKLHENPANKHKLNDFMYYDGNAQGFRIITKLQGWRNRGGLQLTFATLGAFLKYPYSSAFASKEHPKFGFFSSEENLFEDLAKRLHMPVSVSESGAKRYSRHPFAYLVEAADDIAYRTADIEDGIKAGLIPFALGRKTLFEVAELDGHSLKRFNSIEKDSQDQIKFLRTSVSLRLIRYCVGAFVDNIESIMDGSFKGSLIGSSNGKYFEEKSKKLLVDYVYFERRKVRQEAGAYEVIRYLLDVFSGVIESYIELENNFEDLNARDKNLFLIFTRGKKRIIPISEKKKPIAAPYTPENTYLLYMHVVDFISGMTDDYARALYKSIGGHSLGRH